MGCTEPCCDLVPQEGILLLRSCAFALMLYWLQRFPYNFLYGAFRMASSASRITSVIHQLSKRHFHDP